VTTENDAFGQRLAVRKKGRFWKTLGMLTAFVGVAAGGYLTLTHNGRIISSTTKDAIQTAYQVRKNPDLIFQNAGGDHVNILLIGRDTNWKIGKVYDPKTKTYRPYQVKDTTTAARSDTMIIVSLDKVKNTIRMVSLPRDAKVYIPAEGDDSGVHKLNAAHAFGGPELLLRTLKEELGITIQHYAVIKFEGFKALIDQVGGVDVQVDGALKKDRNGKLYRGDIKYDDNWGNLHIDLKPGMQVLDGQQAHNYVRFRMDLEGDPGRIRRQQQVMRALAKKIMKAPPLQIPGLIKEVRKQFETSLSDEEIGSAAMYARGIGDAAKIQPLTLFGSYGRRGSVILNRKKNKKLLATIFGPTFNEEKYLQRSPGTNGDEIGATNDTNPGARAVMIEAGLIDPTDKPDDASDVTKVPVRTERS
jgi:LCP family protein required for cell wall assembly